MSFLFMLLTCARSTGHLASYHFFFSPVKIAPILLDCMEAAIAQVEVGHSEVVTW